MSKLPEKISFKTKYQQNIKLLKEIFRLICENKKWWLLPIYFVFVILSFFLLMVGGGSVLPAIYAIF